MVILLQCLIYCYMNILLKWVSATIKYFYQRKIYIYIYLNSEVSTQPKVCCACSLQVSKKVKSTFAINIKFFMTSILTLVTWFYQMWYCWKNFKWSIENILILASVDYWKQLKDLVEVLYRCDVNSSFKKSE